MMSIVIVFSKIENGKHIKELLTHNGFEVAAVHTTAAAALKEIYDLESGLIISGVRLPDMFYRELRECLPTAFDLLLIGSAGVIQEQEGEGIVALTTPLKVYELLQTVRMMLSRHQLRSRKRSKKPKLRSEKEQKIIDDAKQLLMERNHMTEEEAHRYIQKSSMNSGANLVEAAQMIITLVEFL